MIIELTLATIFAFDTLLKTLLQRSDNLALLSIRLAWEERLIGAWKELHSILGDLRYFLNTRGRWSPAVYDSSLSDDDEQTPAHDTPKDVTPQVVKTIKRKSSMVSLASSTSESVLPSLMLSRRDRFKLAERLSREAALFSSRVSTLKHNRINTAGKALDALIDASHEPVPDELLDEQDKLENEGINNLENLGKFIMGVVVQWKKCYLFPY